MTEFWVSQKNAWCEYCKVWLKDNTQSWAVHERGVKHRENVARKLSEMRKKADQEKQQEEAAAASMGAIEAEARRQYAADVATAEAAQHKQQLAAAAALGEWAVSEGAGYLYNAVQRYYYDPDTGMYYGGEPPAWTKEPKMPREARYEVMKAKKQQQAQQPPPLPGQGQRSTGPSGSTAAAAAGSSGGGNGSTALRAGAVTAGMKAAPKHPMAAIGGHQLHQLDGSIGGAKGVGSEQQAKRKREDGGGRPAPHKGKALSKEEQEALARREAARARVAQRTAASFGLQ